MPSPLPRARPPPAAAPPTPPSRLRRPPAPVVRQPSPALTGGPAAWTGLGALLAGAGERAPADALTLAAVVSGASGGVTRPQMDLSGIWALPADMAAAHGNSVTRTLDATGRMQLPIDADAAIKLPAQRNGALVTVFLPGSPERPRPNFAPAALPLDASGRLTVTAGVRREARTPDGADVLAVVDPDRRTVTLTAASRLTAGNRRAARPVAGSTALSGAADPAGAPATHTVPPDATSADAASADGGETSSAGRLRIVG